MSKIQIEEKLFIDLIRYHLLQQEEYSKTIKLELQRKFDAICRRQAYGKYCNAETAEEKKQTLNTYLESINKRTI